MSAAHGSGERFRLFHYWRSTSSWRVRWGFALKGIVPEYIAVSLLDGESESAAHRARNPFGYVPVLEILSLKTGTKTEESRFLVESLPILEYLDETLPGYPLLPRDPFARAQVRALAEAVNAGTQPLQNLTTQIYVAGDEQPDFAEKRKTWAQHWIKQGMSAYESLAAPIAGDFSYGNEITLADLCLIPQCYAAIRNEIDVANYPTIARIYKNALLTESYRASEPDHFKPN